MSSKKKNQSAISSTERLKEMLSETETELESIQPKIEKLELQLQKLKELKLAKQKLITLKLSIQSILSNFSGAIPTTLNAKDLAKNYSVDDQILNQELNLETKDTKQKSLSTKPELPKTKALNTSVPQEAFIPELAFSQADAVLKRKSSINYDLFRAVVFSGGLASTEQIRQYLIDHQIKQPASGESFEGVALTDISARINYLVRKGLVKPDGRGTFVSCLGWAEAGE